MITIDNFYIASRGEWSEILEVPEGFVYFTNTEQDTVVRVSNHWGYRIKNCDWFLRGRKVCNCKNFQRHYNDKVFIGIVEFNKLQSKI